MAKKQNKHVRNREDIYWAMGVNTFVPLLSGMVIFIYLYSRRELDFVATPMRDIAKALKEGWSVFRFGRNSVGVPDFKMGRLPLH